MAYAQLAGVPPDNALLGSSRQLVVAVSSAVAIMSAATISELARRAAAPSTSP